MDKNLPKVYAVPIEKEIKNNEETYISSLKEESSESISVTEIDKIFNSKKHVYKTRVHIKTKQEEIEADVIGKTNQAILTLDGKKINIEDIIKIKKV